MVAHVSQVATAVGISQFIDQIASATDALAILVHANVYMRRQDDQIAAHAGTSKPATMHSVARHAKIVATLVSAYALSLGSTVRQ